MSALSRIAIKALYNDLSSGRFRDAQAMPISRLRAFVNDIVDSASFLVDDSEFIVLYQDLVIPSASILTGNSIPIEILTPPGVDSAWIPEWVEFVIDNYGTTPYATNTGVDILMGSTSLTGGQFIDFLTATDRKIIFAPFPAFEPLINEAVNFQVMNGDPTAGDSDVRIRMKYRLITL